MSSALALLPPEITVTGLIESLEATPLVDAGIMFVTDGLSRLYRIDVRDGQRPQIDWIIDPEVDRATIGIPSNRGAALLDGLVVWSALDSRLLAASMSTGELVWETPLRGLPLQTSSAAPLAIDGAILWSGGGDAGAIGWIEAVNAETGEALWRFNTVPGPGEEGHDSWGGDSWKSGGGGVWQTGSYDPDSRLTFWGVGNPFPPSNPALRPGDNLFTDSVVALDTTTGALRWYFQYTPNDSREYDAAGIQVLLDLEIPERGVSRTVNSFQRNGFFYSIEMQSGAFLTARQYLDEVNWTAGIDPLSGKPLEYDPASPVQIYRPATRRLGDPAQRVTNVCPEPEGGNTFFPVSYSTVTGLLYSAQIEGCADLAPAFRQLSHAGSVVSLDPRSGRIARKVAKPFANYAGVTATAGGVVFTGYVDGSVEALDDRTLDVLWRSYLGSPIAAAPISYAYGGVQYVVFAAGGSPVPLALFGYPILSRLPNPPRFLQPAKVLFFFSLP